MILEKINGVDGDYVKITTKHIEDILVFEIFKTNLLESANIAYSNKLDFSSISIDAKNINSIINAIGIENISRYFISRIFNNNRNFNDINNIEISIEKFNESLNRFIEGDLVKRDLYYNNHIDLSNINIERCDGFNKYHNRYINSEELQWIVSYIIKE